jgi:hypothetical protein
VNKYVGLSKRDLKDIQLRLFGELSNLRTDSKRARQKLEATRSYMAEVKFDLGLVQEAMRLEAVVQFPGPVLEVEPVLEVAPMEEKRKISNLKI